MSFSMRRDLRGSFADASVFGPVLSVVFLGVVAKAALVTGVIYVLFPELAALSYDIFKRPEGTWARSPVMLVITPAITATMGTALTHVMPYNLASVAITIAGAVLIVRWMRSPIVPAISAAFLPLVFGMTSWWYPASITAVLVFLALVSTVYGRLLALVDGRQASAPDVSAQVQKTQPAPSSKTSSRLLTFAAFLLAVYGVATVTGLRLILFPPLVVIAFEELAHAHARQRPMRHVALLFVCTITASVGLAAFLALGAGPLSVVIALLVGVVTLRALKLHFPPALTIGLLPQIMQHPDWRFVLAVALGIGMLSGAVWLTRSRFLNQSAPLVAG